MSIRRVPDKTLERALEVELGHADMLGKDRKRRRRATVADAVVDDDLGLFNGEYLAHLGSRCKAVGQAPSARTVTESLGLGWRVRIHRVGAEGPP